MRRENKHIYANFDVLFFWQICQARIFQKLIVKRWKDRYVNEVRRAFLSMKYRLLLTHFFLRTGRANIWNVVVYSILETSFGDFASLGTKMCRSFAPTSTNLCTPFPSWAEPIVWNINLWIIACVRKIFSSVTHDTFFCKQLIIKKLRNRGKDVKFHVNDSEEKKWLVWSALGRFIYLFWQRDFCKKPAF